MPLVLLPVASLCILLCSTGLLLVLPTLPFVNKMKKSSLTSLKNVCLGVRCLSCLPVISTSKSLIVCLSITSCCTVVGLILLLSMLVVAGMGCLLPLPCSSKGTRIDGVFLSPSIAKGFLTLSYPPSGLPTHQPHVVGLLIPSKLSLSNTRLLGVQNWILPLSLPPLRNVTSMLKSFGVLLLLSGSVLVTMVRFKLCGPCSLALVIRFTIGLLVLVPPKTLPVVAFLGHHLVSVFLLLVVMLMTTLPV